MQNIEYGHYREEECRNSKKASIRTISVDYPLQYQTGAAELQQDPFQKHPSKSD